MAGEFTADRGTGLAALWLGGAGLAVHDHPEQFRGDAEVVEEQLELGEPGAELFMAAAVEDEH